MDKKLSERGEIDRAHQAAQLVGEELVISLTVCKRVRASASLFLSPPDLLPS